MFLRKPPVHEKAESKGQTASNEFLIIDPATYEASIPRASRKPSSQIHWRAPAILIFSFLIGVVGAIAHHGFYTAMHQKTVQDNSLQRIVLTSGNALAFLVKVSLALSTATAFTQCLWFSLRRDCVTLQNIDTMFGVLGNPVEFCNIRFWLGHPILALTAITTWLLPLSAIFTPSTMSVRPRLQESFESVQVLQRDSNLPIQPLSQSYYGTYVYHGDSPLISNLGNLNLATADTVKVPLLAQNRNISYSTSFAGPAFHCIEANDSIASIVLPAVKEYQELVQQTLLWASWMPTPAFKPGIDGSFFANASFVTQGFGRPEFIFTNTTAQLYHVKFFPSNFTIESEGKIDVPAGTYRVIECTLRNATFDVHFGLRSNGEQIITSNRTLLNVLALGESLKNDTFTRNEAIEALNTIAFAQMYALYFANGLMIDAGSDAEPFLVNSPTLGKAISLQEPNYMDFDQFTFALEQFFENATLSWRFGQLDGVLSSRVPEFSSSPTRNATIQQSVNAFDYDPEVLFISYGAAIGLASVCLICGIFSIYGNAASYTNNFSTILRTTRDREFDRCIEKEDCSGADPLPAHLQDVLVQYGDHSVPGYSAQDENQGLKVVDRG